MPFFRAHVRKSSGIWLCCPGAAGAAEETGAWLAMTGFCCTMAAGAQRSSPVQHIPKEKP